MSIRMQDGRVFAGTTLEIVRAMQAGAFGTRDGPLGEYVDWAVEQASRMLAIDMRVVGSNDAQKASSLVDEMVRTGLAEAWG